MRQWGPLGPVRLLTTLGCFDDLRIHRYFVDLVRAAQ